MPDNVLKAIITADGQQFTKTLGDLQAQLKRFEAGLKSANTVESFNRINRAIDATKQKIASLNTGGTEKFVRGQKQAGQAVVDFSRIIQDAPYAVLAGNISAIANNIDPLVLSLQRAKAAGGSFGGTLKAIGSSLLGGAGLGLGISLITSGLVLFGDKLFGASKETKALEESLDALAESTAKEIVKLSTLVGVVTNVNTSNTDRAKALKAVNQEYGDLLKNLGVEEATLNNINVVYEKIIDNLLRQATIKGLQDEISKAVEETAKQLLTVEVAEEKRRIASEKAAKAAANALTPEQKQLKNLQQAYEQSIKPIQDGQIAQANYELQLRGSIETFDTYENKLARLKSKLQEQIQPLLNLTTKFSDLGINIKESGDKADKSFNELIARAKALADRLRENTVIDFRFDVDPLDTKEETANKAKKFISDATKFIEGTLPPQDIFVNYGIKSDFIKQLREFGKEAREALLKETGLTRNASGQIDIELKPKITLSPFRALGESQRQIDETAQQTYDELQKSVIDNLKKPIQSILNIQLKPDLNRAQVLTEIENQYKVINDSIKSAQVELISTLGETIGNAISGANFNFGDQIFDILGGLAQTIGKAIISIGVIKLGLDTVLESLYSLPGAVIIAIGVAALAVGQVIKNLKSNTQRRQVGGSVQAGQPYIVGEAGRELFVPNVGGRIVSNTQLMANSQAFVGQGVTVRVVGQFVQRGNDLVATIASTNRYQGRNT